jgi:hypothetical protein
MVQGGYPFFSLVMPLNLAPIRKDFYYAVRNNMVVCFVLLLWGVSLSFLDGSYKDTYFSCNSQVLSFHEAVMVTIVPQFTIGLDSVMNRWLVPIVRRQMSIQNVPQYYSMLEGQILRVIEKEIGTLDSNKSYIHKNVAQFAPGEPKSDPNDPHGMHADPPIGSRSTSIELTKLRSSP